MVVKLVTPIPNGKSKCPFSRTPLAPTPLTFLPLLAGVLACVVLDLDAARSITLGQDAPGPATEVSWSSFLPSFFLPFFLPSSFLLPSSPVHLAPSLFIPAEHSAHVLLPLPR